MYNYSITRYPIFVKSGFAVDCKKPPMVSRRKKSLYQHIRGKQKLYLVFCKALVIIFKLSYASINTGALILVTDRKQFSHISADFM